MEPASKKGMEPLEIDKEQGSDASDVSNYEYPPIGDEALDMLYVSLITYGLADLRALARKSSVSGSAAVTESIKTRILDLPITSDEIMLVCNENTEKLKELATDTDTYFSAVQELFKESIGSRLKEEVVVFDDANSDHQLVYAIGTSEPKKRIVVSFRGSVTAMDWLQDSRIQMSDMPNPVKNKDGSRVSETFGVHLGFRDYLYSVEPLPDWLVKVARGKDAPQEKPESISKCKVIMEQVGRLFEQYPNYHLYITGHSLGGALSTLFAVEAAASEDPRINKPVTCINFASPKVGNMEFRRAVSALEEQGKLRCLRVANALDAVPLGPDKPPCVALPSSVFCPHGLFRHVGMRLILKPQPTSCKKPYSLGYSRTTFIRHCSISLVSVPYAFFCPYGVVQCHGCMEYADRLHLAYEKGLDKVYLNQLYNKKVKKGLYKK